MPDFVIVEIDIAANGSVTADPNPVQVESGQTLMFHVNSNASEATMLGVDFPEGPDSPFQVTGHTESFARPCLGVGSKVEWPPGVEAATVRVSAHGSPVLGEVMVKVLASPVDVADLHPVYVPSQFGRTFPNIVHNYYFGGKEVPDNLHVVEDADWECSGNWVAIANTDNCYRYKITNRGPNTVTVKASPSGKETTIKAGSSAYVECSKIEVRTRYGHAHGDVDRA